jgi:anion-transporting  ArsA/GET3 family ATPase
MPLESLLSKRVVLITGKGGVGRSSVTAALANLGRERGRRVLVTEIGDAPEDYSPLARYFGRDRFGLLPEAIEPGLLGVVLLARTGQELFLRTVLHSATIARAALNSEVLRRLLTAGPSFREMGVFFQLLHYLRAARPDGSPEHELILVDMPATGHTLSLTGLPELLLKLVPRGPIAESLKEGQGYLNDPRRAAAWLVTLPETLPVSECLELLEGLQRSAMPVGGVLLNRIPADPFSPAERARLEVALEGREVLGRESFERPLVTRREQRRLLEGTALPVFPLPELPHAGLVGALTRALAVTRPLPRGTP